MKKINVNLEYWIWYLTYDDKIVRENILARKDLIDEIYKKVKSGKIAKFEDLRGFLRMQFMHRYWSKCECEYVVSGLFENMPKVMKRENRDNFTGYKLDIFYQIEKNLNMITEHVIHRMELPIEVPKVFPEDKEFWEKCGCKC